jgi:hypothetical protein
MGVLHIDFSATMKIQSTVRNKIKTSQKKKEALDTLFKRKITTLDLIW